jgi:predicted metal-binding protein
MTKAHIKKFIRSACELGALEAKPVKAASIVTAPWVRLKCRFGCDGYNTSLCCPPNTPTWFEMREVISSYEHALLIHCKEVDSSTRIVCELERQIFLAGYYKAFGLGAGPCRMCGGKCNLKRCVHTENTRPSMEACGIDVYATAKANGYPIAVVKDYKDKANYYGIVLIE